ncbi:MAG: flavodoxin [Flammeovirgaceae bacterium]|nr:flavodoxin [Flammeovirgaceae bacterium]
MGKIGIFYGSTEGNTERVVTKIQEKLGGEAAAELVNVESASAEDFDSYDNVILASSTWEIGELQEDWDNFIDELEDADFDGKKVAFVGTGDADGYPDTFLDAMGLIYEKIEDKDITLVGLWPTDGYNFEESKGMKDGKFLGLAIDEDNQANLTDERVAKWVEMIKPEMS